MTLARWRVVLLAVLVCVAALPFACARRAALRLVSRPPSDSPANVAAWTNAEQVFETRCVVCHGCYDAPCQLKLGTFEGIERGATTAKVYDASRVTAADPTRLETDAHGIDGWRKKGFHPVLPEGDPPDTRASLLLRMLDLKRQHPIESSADVEKDFTLDLDRKETCTTADRFDDYAKQHPLWGMPYAFPGLDAAREKTLVEWVEAGAPHAAPKPLPPAVASAIDPWEAFLDEPSLKGQLVGRYVYEHWFLASLYFKGVDEHTFFRLVRSRTAPGAPVDEIATRRPFDDPKVDRVYYRFVRRLEAPLEKTHMPYPLFPARLKLFRDLFLGAGWDVDRLPGYDPQVAANPFRAFERVPAEARYRFMLEEANFTMMGFIKGPVCRGQVALDVIQDRFWVFFVRPDSPGAKDETAFLSDVKGDLDLPAEGGSTPLPTLWLRFSSQHAKYLQKRNEWLTREMKNVPGTSTSLIWDGDGRNPNAALTVFRHFDSATVVQGLVGRQPKTSWVIDYPLFEQIHYLLVAGFDVFGNVIHQVTTRLYMDFLRMEGETNYLALLPVERRKELTAFWYRGVTGAAKTAVEKELEGFPASPSAAYGSATPEREVLDHLAGSVSPVASRALDSDRVQDKELRGAADKLAQVRGRPASELPEVSFLTVAEPGGRRTHFTILRDTAHTNVAHLFHDDARHLPEEDELTVVPGFLGAYPNALFEVPRAQLGVFVDALAAIADAGAYRALRTRFGVSRRGPRFWPYSDEINDDHRQHDGVAAGSFDYNRLDGM